MTGEQANWLRTNRKYRALGQRAPHGSRYVRIGMLHPDGTFELRERGKQPAVHQGSFEVGMLEVDPNPGMQSGIR